LEFSIVAGQGFVFVCIPSNFAALLDVEIGAAPSTTSKRSTGDLMSQPKITNISADCDPTQNRKTAAT
jgi:hypothetical protein